MEKKGASHVEIILSFVLFISTVTLALYIFNPLTLSSPIQSSISFVTTELTGNISLDVTTYAIKITPGAQTSLGVEISESPSLKARVETYSGSKLPYSRSSNIISFNRQGNDLVLIKFSEDFIEDNSISLQQLNQSAYEIISSVTENLVSEKRAIELSNAYIKDYASLKKYLKITSDFSFSLTFSPSDKIIAEKQIPSNIPVLSDIKRKQIIRSSGNTAFADLGLKIW